MYVTFVFPRPQPGQAAEYARRWKAILAPRARALPGFRAAYEERTRMLDGVATIEAMVLAMVALIDALRGEGGDGGADTE